MALRRLAPLPMRFLRLLRRRPAFDFSQQRASLLKTARPFCDVPQCRREGVVVSTGGSKRARNANLPIGGQRSWQVLLPHPDSTSSLGPPRQDTAATELVPKSTVLV